MPFNDQSNPLNYPANSRDAFRRFRIDRAPTSEDFQNFRIGDFWIDTSAEELYFLVDKSGTALWILLSSGPGPGVESLTGNIGGPIPADGAENINIKGTGKVNVVGTVGNNTLTISSSAGAPETLTGNSGGAVSPDGNDNIFVKGTGNVTVVGTPGNNTLTISDTGANPETLTGNTGDIVGPDANNNIFVKGTGNVTVNGDAGTNTLTISDTNTDVKTLTGNTGGAITPDGGGNISVIGATPLTVDGDLGANKLTINTNGKLTEQYTTDSGIAKPDAGNLNVFGDGPLTTSATGSTITISSNPTVDSFNLGFTFSAGTFSITAADGSALSSTNKGFVRVSKKTVQGTFLYIPVTANQTFIDSSGASTIIGNLFGLSTGIAYTRDIPFFIYGVVNDAENEIAFMISRFPLTFVSPVAAKIGQSGSAIASTQGSFFSLKSITATDFESNPTVRLGSFRMQMNASDDWAVTAFNSNDGIGAFQQQNRFSVPVGTFGAKANNTFIDNGGTAPTIAGVSPLAYEVIDDQISLDGAIDIVNTGVGAVTLISKMPFNSAIGGLVTAGNFMTTDNTFNPAFIGTTQVTLGSNNLALFGTNPTDIRALLNTDPITSGNIYLRAFFPVEFS